MVCKQSPLRGLAASGVCGASDMVFEFPSLALEGALKPRPW